VDLRQELMRKIQENGLQVHFEDGVYTQEVETNTSLEALEDEDIDTVFLCVKSIHLTSLMEPLKVFEHTNAVFVCVQNGIDSEKVLAHHFDREKIFRIVPNFAGMILESGVVKQSFFHAPNFLGTLGERSFDKAKRLASLLTESGLETEFSLQYQKEVWRKSMLNSTLMPISVVSGATMSDLMQVGETRNLIEELLGELLRIAEAEGHCYEPDFMSRCMDYLSRAGHHKTSMLMDFEAGRPLEIPFLNEKFEEYAQKHDIHACKNKVLCRLIKSLIAQRDFHLQSKAS